MLKGSYFFDFWRDMLKYPFFATEPLFGIYDFIEKLVVYHLLIDVFSK
jgi:hypothetical protein